MIGLFTNLSRESASGAQDLPRAGAVAFCLAILLAGCQRGAQHAASLAKNGGSQTPKVSRRCWIYDRIFPATAVSYKNQHVSSAQRKEIEKWAGSVPMSERGLVRWMRLPSNSARVLVFVAQPLHREGGYYPWNALNTNIVIDPDNDCAVMAYPKV
jgi:hypothetical protein